MGTATDLVHGQEPAAACGWTWRAPRRGEHFRTCSWCGSVHPQDLLATPRGTGSCATCGAWNWETCLGGQRGPGDLHNFEPGGWWLSWADWEYGWPHKMYVESLRPAHPGTLHCLSRIHGREPEPRETGLDWYRARDLTPELLAIAADDGMQPDPGEDAAGWFGFGTKDTLHARLYSVHLNDPAVDEATRESIFEACGLRLRFSAAGTASDFEPWKPRDETGAPG
jgi:hypothetical protein